MTDSIEKEFVPYQESLELKEIGFDEPCFGWWAYPDDVRFDFPPFKNIDLDDSCFVAPTFLQVVNFLYICSNKQIDIELKASDTYEERIRKITKGCEDLRNIQNNKSN